MSNQSEAASILCKPIGAKLWAPGELQLSVGLLIAHQLMPLGAPLAQYKPSWSVQKLRRLSLHDTNVAPIRNNKMQAALHSALFNYTPLVIRGTDKNKQLTIIKPTKTAINRNK